MEDFAGDFPGGFFWPLFPHKNEEKKSGDKIRDKNPAAPKIKIREKSVLPKSDPKKLETGTGGVKSPKNRGGVKILNFEGPLKLTHFYRDSIENRQLGGQKSKPSRGNFRASSPPSSVRYVLTPLSRSPKKAHKEYPHKELKGFPA